MIKKALGGLLKKLFPGQSVPVTNPLFEAIENRDSQKIKALLEKGADLNLADETGRTAIMLAVSLPGNNDIAMLLIKSGADIMAVDKNGKSVVDYVFEPEEPPVEHENAYEAWIHCEEHYLQTCLYQMIEEKKAAISVRDAE